MDCVSRIGPHPPIGDGRRLQIILLPCKPGSSNRINAVKFLQGFGSEPHCRRNMMRTPARVRGARHAHTVVPQLSGIPLRRLTGRFYCMSARSYPRTEPDALQGVHPQASGARTTSSFQLISCLKLRHDEKHTSPSLATACSLEHTKERRVRKAKHPQLATCVGETARPDLHRPFARDVCARWSSPHSQREPRYYPRQL